MSFHAPNEFRVRSGDWASDDSIGACGAFVIPNLPLLRQMPSAGANHPDLALRAIADDELGWEHVSVSLARRCPTWEEMCYVKGLFWDSEDCVMQLHPPQSDYVNCHPYCLHLWRPVGGAAIPVPPSFLVGPTT
jgi:hypothetical protein